MTSNQLVIKIVIQLNIPEYFIGPLYIDTGRRKNPNIYVYLEKEK